MRALGHPSVVVLCAIALASLLPSPLHAQQNTPPYFTSGTIIIPPIDENTPEGSPINEGNPVVAMDDEGDPLTYLIPDGSINSNLFSINNSSFGVLFVRTGALLDREVYKTGIEVRVRADDGMPHDVPLPETSVFVFLKDLNDNPPSFVNFLSPISVPENFNVGNEVVQVEATDPDAAANGQVEYSLEENGLGLFRINPTTGSIILNKSLDYETAQSHIIRVVAKDRGDDIVNGSSMNRNEELRILVLDFDDEPPVFSQPSYAVAVLENLTLGDNVLTVSARDGDTGIDTPVTYTITAGNEAIGSPPQPSFSINATLGDITVAAASGLDREQVPQYVLDVTATEDTGRQTTVKVTVTLVDVNDNTPMFDQLLYSANVSENAAQGSTVLTLTASDPDHGIHGDFTFILTQDTSTNTSVPFSITHDEGNGALLVDGTLDFDLGQQVYQFQVLAVEDIATQPRTGTASVLVYVDNENDNSPVFLPSDSYTVSVLEEEQPPVFVLQVNATDGDRGLFGELRYSLEFGTANCQGLFSIDPLSGVINTTQKVDREATPTCLLVVTAMDNGGVNLTDSRSSKANVQVTVVDINDNVPMFLTNGTSTLTADIIEEGAPPLNVITFQVEDPDSDQVQELTFSFASGNELGHFKFDSLNPASVVTDVRLDYETISNYTLLVVVNDSIHWSSVELEVMVTDTNDHSPEFQNQSYVFNVLESVAVMDEVGTVEAEDEDDDLFGLVVYSLDGTGADSFDLNNETGVLSVAKSLDREATAVYSLTVTAMDSDPDAPRDSTVDVTINVLDVNDNAPVFSQLSYSFQVLENSAVLRQVDAERMEVGDVQVTAVDVDAGDNMEVAYSIASGNTNNTLIIDSSSGVIGRNPNKTIDREQVASYQLVVVAMDAGNPMRNSSVNVTITVLDDNDEMPSFAQTAYDGSVEEERPPGTTVTCITASDADEGENGELSYSLDTSTAGSVNFMINEDSGCITTTTQLDRETDAGPFSLKINAADPDHTGSTDVFVSIIDINDEVPIFNPTSYLSNICEGEEVGLLVATVTATDNDQVNTSNSELQYYITDVIAATSTGALIDGITGYFNLSDPSVGVITTSKVLDYETYRSYRIDVVARDMAPPYRESEPGRVNVMVCDVNDQRPSFASSTYSFSVSEERTLNTRLPALTASDLDTGTNGELRFTGNVSSPFSLDPISGELVLIASLDYETDTQYTFDVMVTDLGIPPLNDTALVIVTVTDVNDETPTFTKMMFEANVTEANYSTGVAKQLITVEAVDRDSGVFGDVTYSIVSGGDGLFAIHQGSGLVSAVGNIDREAQASFTLTIAAEDGGSPSLSSSAELLITVLDINDNAPMYAQVNYTGSVVEEDSNGPHIVATVSASDADEGTNSDIVYSISNTNDFMIGNVSGEVTAVGVLDYETQSRYDLTVTATDSSTSDPMSTTVILTVYVEDINDNSPTFTDPSPAPLTLEEDTPTGTVVATPTAMDADSSSNGQIVYSLSNGRGQFAIDETTGEVVLIDQLSWEVTSFYNLSIEASDLGQPTRTAVVHLEVNVLDINDNVPVFSMEIYPRVAEETEPVGSCLVTVEAYDPDEGVNGEVKFQIQTPPANTIFELQQVTTTSDGVWKAEVCLAEQLDYEMSTFHSIIIEAYNEGSLNVSTAQVVISVLDVNDNSPVFTMPGGYVIEFPETTPANTDIGTVVATDSDGGVNGQVTYKFADDTPQLVRDTFALDTSTGVLTLLRQLNLNADASSYMFLVIANDLGDTIRSSNASVQAKVLDSNDNAPVFDMVVYEGTVLENQPPGTSVLTVNATEKDTGALGNVNYFISGVPEFSVDQDTGVITTNMMLDRELNSRYLFSIRAEDNGSPPQTSYAQVDITVADVNDNEPDFGTTAVTVSLPEGSPIGITVQGVPLAQDLDEGDNGHVTYTLVPASDEFTVNLNTGAITTKVQAGELDREAQSSYMLELIATDSATAPLQKTTLLELTILLSDINDNPPVFQNTPYEFDIAENSLPDKSVGVVMATDADEGVNALVTYSILSGDTIPAHFKINPSTGLIETTSNPIDREDTPSYTLTVRAVDQGNPQRNADVEVLITVEDENDNKPMFTNTVPYTINTTEAQSSETAQRVVGQVNAVDLDEGPNEMVHYEIVAGNTGNAFDIDELSGEIIANPASDGPDYETQPTYVLTVSAYDLGANRMSSTTSVTVYLEDVNDNAPMFTMSEYKNSVRENATVGDIVLVVMAMDEDSGSNGMITYAITTATTAFSVDAVSGTVRVATALDSEINAEYVLIVTASDQGDPKMSGMTTVTITVLNIDDNNPVFERSFFDAELLEDTPVHSVVATVVATDPDDPGAQLEYIIASGDVNMDFTIDSNGMITTVRELDREAIPVYTLVVVAEDAEGRKGMTTLQVTLKDVNDESPKFELDSYTAEVREGSGAGTPVIITGNASRITAFDSDQPDTKNSQVLYTLEGDESSSFRIDFKTGIVTVAPGALLDREGPSGDELTFFVVASDGVDINPLSSSVMLTVTLLDVNDEAPAFTMPLGYSTAVMEDAATGTLISSLDIEATDPDTGGGGVVRYSLTSSNPLDAVNGFSIDPITGDLTLEDSLDRETTEVITLTVTGTDQGSPALSSSVNVQITVVDINDNPPQFAQPIYNPTVSEFLPVGASVVTVTATDPDISSNGDITYSIVTLGQPFLINPDTGLITTTGTLDYESDRMHKLIVQACDKGMVVMCGSSTVVVSVQDINDNAPQFDYLTYITDLYSDLPVGATFINPVAVDIDSAPNAQLTYSISGDTTGIFSINSSTGEISTASPFTEDQLNTTLTFTVIATDSGVNPMTGSATVSINLFQFKDTASRIVFSQPYFVETIPEDSTSGSSVLMVTADNTDVGLVAIIELFDFNPFKLPVANPFGVEDSDVDDNDITIELDEALDREVRSVYTLQIRSLIETGYTTVTVRVSDVNDNAPEFSLTLYMYSVLENQPSGTAVGQVEASDADEGPNGAIEYSIREVTNPGGSFRIDGYGDIFTNASIDREEYGVFNLIVEAKDQGSPLQLSNTTNVMVTILDLNDDTPTFTMEVYNVSISESMPAGSTVAVVTAIDRDLGSNMEIVYTVTQGDITTFSLDSESGVITTLAALDYEIVQSYTLVVRATDKGASLLSSTATVVISVIDFNDCAPTFGPTLSTREEELESAPNGTIITELRPFVTDCDSGENGLDGLMFSIIAGNVGNRFSIDPVSGIVRTVGTLDREVQESYLLSLQAQDSAAVNPLSSIIEVEVVVLDVNDNAPIFPEGERNFSISLPETQPLDQVIQEFTASDADAGENSAISYTLLGGGDVFVIDGNTGDITLENSLDRETTPTYSLTVVAHDNGESPMSSSATMRVTVIDVNDNAPQITNTDTEKEEPEDLSTGSTVFTITAMDSDDPTTPNGQVTLALTAGNEEGKFDLIGDNIVLSAPLDYEETSRYDLVVTVTDKGTSPTLSSFTTFTVFVTDVNDNPPVFAQASYTGSQREGEAPSIILRVSASDADQPDTPASNIQYSITSGNSGLFDIDPETGDISNTAPLDREMQDSYTLTVQATNNQDAYMRYDAVDVFISVLDINDEEPMFVEATLMAASVKELTPIDTVVLQVQATDGDEANTPNSEVLYKLADDTLPFSVDLDTGELKISRALDYEQVQSYQVVIIAEDKGSDPVTQSTSAEVSVTVTDENDQPPVFTQTVYSVSLPENSNVSNFLTLDFTDEDTVPNSVSTYSIVAVTGHSESQSDPVVPYPFSINSASGELSLVRPLDRETFATYTITVTVTNTPTGFGALCAPEFSCVLSGSASVEVTVTDVNDNSPVFSLSSYTGQVSTTAPIGTTVLTIMATDADEGNNAKLKFELVDSQGGLFRLEQKTVEGVEVAYIVTRVSFEEFDGITYNLKVRVTDMADSSGKRRRQSNGGAPLSTEVNVQILAIDDFKRVLIVFTCPLDTILTLREDIITLLSNFSGLSIVVESIEVYEDEFAEPDETRTSFIFHAVDQSNTIVDYDNFFSRFDNSYDLLFLSLCEYCCAESISPVRPIPEAAIPGPAVDVATMVILVLCGILVALAIILLFLSLYQRYVALHDARNKLLANVFYGSPGETSMVENINMENFQLEQLEMRGQAMSQQNPMFVHPYDNWAGIEAGSVSVGETASLQQQDNPLYEEQEIRMEMFADVSDEEEEEDVDEAKLLAAALEDDDNEDTSVTAI